VAQIGVERESLVTALVEKLSAHFDINVMFFVDPGAKQIFRSDLRQRWGQASIITKSSCPTLLRKSLRPMHSATNSLYLQKYDTIA